MTIYAEVKNVNQRASRKLNFETANIEGALYGLKYAILSWIWYQN